MVSLSVSWIIFTVSFASLWTSFLNFIYSDPYISNSLFQAFLLLLLLTEWLHLLTRLLIHSFSVLVHLHIQPLNLLIHLFILFIFRWALSSTISDYSSFCGLISSFSYPHPLGSFSHLFLISSFPSMSSLLLLSSAIFIVIASKVLVCIDNEHKRTHKHSNTSGLRLMCFLLALFFFFLVPFIASSTSSSSFYSRTIISEKENAFPVFLIGVMAEVYKTQIL